MHSSERAHKTIVKKRIKASRKLSKLSKKGRLPAHFKQQIKCVKNERESHINKKMKEIHDDWILDRKYKEMEEDFLSNEEQESSDDELSPDQVRKFEIKKELLPIKVGSRVIRRTRSEKEDDCIASSSSEVDFDPIVSTNTLAEVERDEDEHVELSYDQVERKIISLNNLLISDPQSNILSVHEIIRLAKFGEERSETSQNIQELAIVLLTQTFINIVPGYNIRLLTDVEKKQKMKKDTHQLVTFEENLLKIYEKFIKLLRRNSTSLIDICKKGKSNSVSLQNNISFRLCMISARCMCNLLEQISHFNYAEMLAESVVRITVVDDEQINSEICESIASAFKDDYEFRISLTLVKAIANFANEKKCYVPCQLIATFLCLNIKEIEKKTPIEKEHARSKRRNLKNERKSKKTRKFDKQIGRLDAELREALTNENATTKLRHATETMKYVFLTYFRILKRMPMTALLTPVLEGLNKFVHLINIEFFDDLILLMNRLIQQEQLKLFDALCCIRTTCVILSGEGQALNIDLTTFARKLYEVIPQIPFESDETLVEKQIELLANCIDVLLIKNRKNVSLNRVSSFIKRMLLIATALSTKCTLAILAVIRQLFVSFPNLKTILEDEDELVGGIYSPDNPDPDLIGASSISLKYELNFLSMHPNNFVRVLSKGLSSGLAVTGIERRYLTMNASDWISNTAIDRKRNFYEIKKYHEKQGNVFSSKTICSAISKFVETRSSFV